MGTADNRGHTARERFGEVVRAAREAHGLTVRSLADQWGKDAGSVSKLEHGRLASRVPRTYTDLYAILQNGLRDAGVDADAYVELVRELGIELQLSPIPAKPAPEQDRHVHSVADPTFATFADQARRLSNLGEAEAAIRLFQAAHGMASNPAERATALTEEAWERWRLADDGYRPSLRKCGEALSALGLRATTGTDPPRVLALTTNMLGERELAAYGWTALRIGQTHYRLGQFGAAERWLGAAQEVGQTVEDHTVQWEALHFRMRSLFDQGTQPPATPAGLDHWRRVRHRPSLERAEALLREAKGMPNQHVGWLSRAHELRWEDRVARYLGRPSDARAAREAAAAMLSDVPDLAHVRWDQGLLVLLDAPADARRYLHEALALSWEVKYAKMVSDALRLLGQVEGGNSNAAHLKLALDYSVCSLLAYPAYLDQLDGYLTIAFCVDVLERLAYDPVRLWQRYRAALRDAILTTQPPFHVLLGLHTSDPPQLATIHRVLQAIDYDVAAADL